MSEILINSKYAPGIPTYGIPGKEGDKGQAGFSLYFSPYDSSTNDDMIAKIKNNQFVTDADINDTNDINDRKYQNNDLFLFSTGDIYRINDINNTGNNIFESEPVCNLLESCKEFYINSDTQTLTIKNNNKLLLSDVSIDDINPTSLLTLAPNKNNNLITLLTPSMKGVTVKSVNNDIVVDGDIPINVENLFVAYDTSYNDVNIYTVNNKNYYKVVTTHDKLLSDDEIYTKEGDVITINVDCECRYINNDDDTLTYISEYVPVDASKTLSEYKKFEIFVNLGFITKYISIK